MFGEFEPRQVRDDDRPIHAEVRQVGCVASASGGCRGDLLVSRHSQRSRINPSGW